MKMQKIRTTIPLLFWLVVSSVCGQDARYFRILGPVQTTITAFSQNGHITWTNASTNVTFTVQTSRSVQGLDNWVDYICVPATNPGTTHWLFDPNPPMGMALIPAGLFQMGDALDDGYSPDGPIHTNYVSAVYMDTCEVTKALWDDVYQWATNNGYSFTNAGMGKMNSHPVQSVNWYDALKWCNARSEREGRTPAYYTDEGQTNVYRSGDADVQNDWVNWDAGYRLPTEAEWEKAARAGAHGRRFSWGDADSITHARANYSSSTNHVYDESPTQGFNTNFNTGGVPYTGPAGFFASNGYGLFDTTGNVSEWCWDKYDSTWYTNPAAIQADTRGPAGFVGDNAGRIYRGGAYGNDAFNCRVAYRRSTNRGAFNLGLGFRTVLPIQP